jgi:lipid A disaccharide synthetase
MKPIGKQKLPHQHFGLCIFPFNAAHVVRAGCFVVYIGHTGEFKVSSFRFKVRKKKFGL